MRILFLIVAGVFLVSCVCPHTASCDGIDVPDYQPDNEKQFYDDVIDNPPPYDYEDDNAAL